MRKLDYEFFKDLTTSISYLLFAVSFLGEKFLPNVLVGIISAFFIIVIVCCIITMFVVKRNG